MRLSTPSGKAKLITFVFCLILFLLGLFTGGLVSMLLLGALEAGINKINTVFGQDFMIPNSIFLGLIILMAGMWGAIAALIGRKNGAVVMTEWYFWGAVISTLFLAWVVMQVIGGST